MRFEASVYRESHRRKVIEERNNLIGYILIGVSILLILIDFHILGFSIGVSVFAYYFIWAFIRWNKPEPARGSFPFKMIITENGIQLGQKLYPFSEISVLKFSITDYKRQLRNELIGFAKYPTKSNGTRNQLHFTYQNSLYKIRFRLDHKKHFCEAQNIRAVITDYF
ncbi:hypothetical protein [Ekhidna sp.]|uniref:hypothetical protein n=1 Tax=Ekhidna sp. TaxID=2608089 RepID=UPI003B50507E